MQDQERIDAVHQLNLLDTPAEGRFDRITRVARSLFGTQVALISLLDQERHWFKSVMGLVDLLETEREDSFGAAVVKSGQILVVEDASKDARFASSPLVAGSTAVRFYAGVPLRARGQVVGTLCIMDPAARSLEPGPQQLLKDLSVWAETELKSVHLSESQQQLIAECERLQEMALVDPLTRTWNRTGILEVLDKEWALSQREHRALGAIVLDIDHFKKVNDTYGHDGGDEVLKRVADRLRLSVRPYDAIGRMGGEEFLILLPKSGPGTVERVAERIRQAVQDVPIEVGDTQVQVTVSLGGNSLLPDSSTSREEFLRAADQALYQAKSSGRNRLTMAPPEH